MRVGVREPWADHGIWRGRYVKFSLGTVGNQAVQCAGTALLQSNYSAADIKLVSKKPIQ